MKKNVLVTGHPGVGKTTLLRKLMERFGHLAVSGFYTEEIRENRIRVGFRAVTLSGSSAVFAHRDFHVDPPHRVGKYGVKPEVLEALVLPHVDPYRKGAHLVVIDEIAKMELFSARVKTGLVRALDSPCPVLGTISLKGSGLIKRAKERPDVLLFTLTLKNRGVLGEQVYRALVDITRSSHPQEQQLAFAKFIQLFDRGAYWESHEALEVIWKSDPQNFYKGLIQVAAAWVHLQRHNRAGALKVLPRALRYLEQYPSPCLGWDISRLIADCRRCLESLRQAPEAMALPEDPCQIRMASYYGGSA